MKGVFDTRPVTKYDDDISQRYHIPNRYLEKAKHTEKDWIVYRETRRDRGRQGYVAVARVSHIEPHPSVPNSSYVYVSCYLEFDQTVPFRYGKQYYETQFNLEPNRSKIGPTLQGNPVRTITEDEFGAITLAGFVKTLHDQNPHRLEYGKSGDDQTLQAFVESTPEEQKRQIAQMLVNRPLRDWAFRRAVVTAYNETCAVTGLRMVNGGGKAEVQAAHIRPVKHGGPDIVPNGIALSATCHWLFDRHLISLRDDYSLLVAHNRVPSEFQDLFSNQLCRIHLPKDEKLRPHRAYIEWHRERFLGA